MAAVEGRKTTPDQVRIQVELFGLARIISGRRQVEIAVPGEAEPRHVVMALSEICPQMVGKVIREDLSGLQESYTFNLNGKTFVSDGPLNLQPSDRILLFSSQAGG